MKYTIRGKEENRRRRRREKEGEREKVFLRVCVSSLPSADRTEADAADAGDAAAVLSWLECQLFHSRCADCNVKGQLLQYFLDESVIRQKGEKEEVHSIGPRAYSMAGQRSGLMQLRRGYTHRFCTSRALEGFRSGSPAHRPIVVLWLPRELGQRDTHARQYMCILWAIYGYIWSIYG